MKGRLLTGILITAIIIQSCTRVMTPYQAANSPRGKKCAIIR